jgi:SET domain
MYPLADLLLHPPNWHVWIAPSTVHGCGLFAVHGLEAHKELGPAAVLSTRWKDFPPGVLVPTSQEDLNKIMRNIMGCRYINHSYDPLKANLHWEFDDGVYSFFTAREIVAGEELLIDYGPLDEHLREHIKIKIERSDFTD